LAEKTENFWVAVKKGVVLECMAKKCKKRPSQKKRECARGLMIIALKTAKNPPAQIHLSPGPKEKVNGERPKGSIIMGAGALARNAQKQKDRLICWYNGRCLMAQRKVEPDSWGRDPQRLAGRRTRKAPASQKVMYEVQRSHRGLHQRKTCASHQAKATILSNLKAWKVKREKKIGAMAKRVEADRKESKHNETYRGKYLKKKRYGIER